MSSSPRTPLAVACSLALTLVAMLAVPAAGSPSAPPLRCQASVIGQAPDGRLVLGPVTCSTGGFTTLMTVATHFKGPGGSGASLAISGTGCSGGWMNMPAGWVNNISSTSGPCNVGHFDSNNLQGASEDTPAGATTTLTALDNRTNSAIYY
jgi:hypothetical protein